jgi:hypothetical protein
MISVATEGGTVTNYSPRFSIRGMTGTFPPEVIEGMSKVTGTEGPKSKNEVANNLDAAPGAGDAGIPYNQQEGLTKYAPMQPIPPTKITKEKHTPLNPTSDVPVAHTWLPPASQLTTITASQTFKVQGLENTVSIYQMNANSNILTFPNPGSSCSQPYR